MQKVRERKAAGRAVRKKIPKRGHGFWKPAPERPQDYPVICRKE